jgi:flagellar basal body-associated protein FliL
MFFCSRDSCIIIIIIIIIIVVVVVVVFVVFVVSKDILIFSSMFLRYSVLELVTRGSLYLIPYRFYFVPNLRVGERKASTSK